MKKIVGISALSFVAAVSLCFIAAPDRAEAFGARVPDLDSTPGTAQVYLVNGETRYVQKTNSLMRLWFTQRSGNSVVIANGNYCSSNTGDDIETEDRPGGFGSIPNGHNITRFVVKGAGQNGPIEIERFGRKYASSNDSACNATITINIPTISASKIENGYYFVNLDIDHVTGYRGPMNSFVLRAAPSSSSYAGLVGDNNGYNMTLDQSDSSPANIRYTAEFGTDCDNTANEASRIYFYDLDNGGASGAQQNGKVTVKLWRFGEGYVNFSGSSNGNPGETWTPSNGENSTQWLEFTARVGAKYRLEMYNVYHNNTIQFSLPYSQINRLSCPPPPPPGTIRPYQNLGGTEFEVGSQVTPTAGVNNSSPAIPASSNYTRQLWYENGIDTDFNTNSATTNIADVMIQTRGPSVRSYSPGNNTDTTPGTLSGGSWNVTIPINTTHRRICQRVVLTAPANPAGTIIATTLAQCASIVRLPYISVRNGDVNTTCNDGTIKAIWNPTVGNGSGTQLAVFAGSTINGFVSAFGRTAPGPLSGLTFANSGVPATSYGTAFGGDAGDCGNSVVIPAGISNSGNRTYATMQEAVNSAVSGGFYKDNTVYINGNLTISGSGFNYPVWSNLSDMPYFKAAVTGNIYIESTVSEINGVYKSNGTIYTCTVGGLPPSDIASINPACLGNSLTVNGALEANNIKYLRLRGSTALVNQSAETVIYDPLIWLKAIKQNTVPGSGSKNFDSYTIMPPIL